MKKKIDERIQKLIEKILKLKQRGFFIIIGDRGRDQVVNLHYFISKEALQFSKFEKPKVLWCYKKNLGFSSHKKKRIKEIKKLQSKGLYNSNIDDPFDLFISSQEIRYCYYKESHKILGQTFSMLILSDFESITPNLLCRTVETIQGGGIIILLLNQMKSLKQVYSLVMDVHSRYRTSQFSQIIPRFNERFILSLAKCDNCLVLDDELNVLPINMQEIPQTQVTEFNQEFDDELLKLKQEMKSNEQVGQLIQLCQTLDQAKVVMLMSESLMEKQQYTTLSLTAARGRGKSASIGLAVAFAIYSQAYNNIFISAPNPENLITLFEFVCKGLECFKYSENLHYEAIQSTNPNFNNSIIRINIFKTHKQQVQYILPQHSAILQSCDLLVIDEAAAIPLHLVKKLLGAYPTFISSTVNGYEGTGRSLSLKLIAQLRTLNLTEKQNHSSDQFQEFFQIQQSGSIPRRIIKEITMKDPIRYSQNDPIEKWLNMLLLLEATQAPELKYGLPHPKDCGLYLVNRDTLFSFHQITEIFLFNLMSLFISSHYKNSPNDLQLLSDAPAHCIFALINNGPQKNNQESKELPDIICAVQICLEGHISKSVFQNTFDKGNKPSGDLIPWTIAEQFQDQNFTELNGARIIRIATHPKAQHMGYGTRCLELLLDFFQAKQIFIKQENFYSLQFNMQLNNQEYDQQQQIAQKKKLHPLLKALNEINPPFLHYIGVAYGLTFELFKFWKKSLFFPLYLRQVQNDITAEHSCIMIRPLIHEINKMKQYSFINQTDEMNIIKDQYWIDKYSIDFQKRFMTLLASQFREISVQLSLQILNPNLTSSNIEKQAEKTVNDCLIVNQELLIQISYFDLKRLEAYSKNLVDYHLISDLIPILSRFFFGNRFSKNVTLSFSQAAILVGLGLQFKTIEVVASEIDIPVSQALALFNKSIKKLTGKIKHAIEEDIKYETFGPQQIDVEREYQSFKQTNNDIIQEGKIAIEEIEMKNLNQNIVEDKVPQNKKMREKTIQIPRILHEKKKIKQH